MAGMPVHSIIEVTYNQRVNGQTLMNVLHYRNENDYSAKDPIVVCDNLLNILKVGATNPMVLAMKAFQAFNLSYTSVSVQMIYPDRYIRRSAAMALTGDDASPCSAQNVAAVITKTGVFANRASIGSFHLGGLGAGGYVGGELTAVGYNLLGNIAAQMLINIAEPGEGTTWFPAIRNMTPVVGSNPPRFKIGGSGRIFYTTPQKTLRTMRRRTVGLGI